MVPASTSAAHVASTRPARDFDGIRYSLFIRVWMAFSGHANVIGLPWCRSGGSHVLAVRTVAVRVTPICVCAVIRVVGPA